MKKLIIAAVIGIGAYMWWQHRAVQINNIEYTDVNGTARTLGAGGKPAIVGFWIADCGYSGHALYLLSRIRQQYSESQLDVVGFYLNSITREELAKLVDARSFGFDYNFTMAPAQPPVELIAELAKTFNIRGPGRNLYVISKTGAMRAVDISDIKEPNEAVLKKLNSVINSLISR